MRPIITITFSPCIDKSTSVPGLIPEKKLKCSTPKLEPGGGGINVARAIKKLGGEPVAIFPAGGYTGKHFCYLMQKEWVESVVIETRNETRENIIVFDELAGKQYRLGMPGTQLEEKEWQGCLDAVLKQNDPEFIIASGSLPPGVPDNIYTLLARIAKSKQAKLIVDASGEALKHAADAGVYLLKPNLSELSVLTGMEDINPGTVESIARNYIMSKNCDILVVSMGESGALLVTKTETHRVIPPAVKCISTVGAGDSMVAGIVMGLSRNMSLKETLQYGVACGTAATLHPGTELCTLEDTLKLMKDIKMQ
jgi:6-phosphofructokinase 2